MFTFIKDKIAEVLDDIQRRKEEREAGRKIRRVFGSIALALVMLCVGYFIGAHRDLIETLIMGE